MTLCVYLNGVGRCKRSHLSVSICLMSGENDDKLMFPFYGMFIIKLLNWKQDSNHIEKSIVFDEATPKERNSKVPSTKKQAEGHYKRSFCTHGDLTSAKHEEYIREQRVCFEVQFLQLLDTPGL